MVTITPIYPANDPSPALNAKVPVKVEMEYQGKKLTFTASDALAAWDDNPEHAKEAAKELLRAMLREVW